MIGEYFVVYHDNGERAGGALSGFEGLGSEEINIAPGGQAMFSLAGGPETWERWFERSAAGRQEGRQSRDNKPWRDPPAPGPRYDLRSTRDQRANSASLRVSNRAQRERSADPGARFRNRGEGNHFTIEVSSPRADAEEGRAGIGVKADLAQLRNRQASGVRAEIELICAVAGKDVAAPVVNAQSRAHRPTLQRAVRKRDDAGAVRKIDDRAGLQRQRAHSRQDRSDCVFAQAGGVDRCRRRALTVQTNAGVVIDAINRAAVAE